MFGGGGVRICCHSNRNKSIETANIPLLSGLRSIFMCVCTQNNLWIQAFSNHRFLRNELRSSSLVAGIFYLLSLFICQPLVLLSHYVALLSCKLPTCLSLSFARVTGLHHHAHSSLIERIFKVVGQRSCL